MKAAILSESGLAIVEVPKPEIKPNELLVRVRAAGLNRADLLMIGGRMHGPARGPVAQLAVDADQALARFPTFDHVIELIRVNRDVKLLVEQLPAAAAEGGGAGASAGAASAIASKPTTASGLRT